MSVMLSAAIRAANAELQAETADTLVLVHEAFRIRHQVYCVERRFEAAAGEIETDYFDKTSRHVLLRKRASGEVIGTVRLVIGDTKAGPASYPMAAACSAAVFAGMPVGSTAEVSRFSLSKDRSGLSPEAVSLARLVLIRGLLNLTQRAGVTHWCATMDRTLLRLLRSSGIHFLPVGPLVEYHGLRQPAVCCVADMLARMHREQPGIWAFLTDHGRLASTWTDVDLARAA